MSISNPSPPERSPEELWAAIWASRGVDPAATAALLRAYHATDAWRDVFSAAFLANLATEAKAFDLSLAFLNGMLAAAPDLGPPHPDAPWPPEVDARRDPPESAAQLLNDWGVVLVRHVFPLDQLGPIADRWSARLNAGDQAARLLPLTEALPPGHGLDAEFIPSYLREVARPFLPAGDISGLWGGYVRAVHPAYPTGLHWHQDVTAFCRYSVNLWAPITACGVDAPGLECAARRCDRVFATTAPDANPDAWAIDADAVPAWCSPDRWFAPEMAPGDAALFLGSTLHRSQVTPAMIKMRVSLELRME